MVRGGGPVAVEQRCLSGGQSLTTRLCPASPTPGDGVAAASRFLLGYRQTSRRRDPACSHPANEPLPVRKENFVTASIVSVPPANHLHHPNPVYENTPTFQMACRQLQDIAEHTDIEQGILERLSMPKRAIVVAVPIRMDDGS